MINMRLFAKNFSTFLLALVLGISVWVSAVSVADPNEVQPYPNPIPLQVIGQDPSLVVTGDLPSTVEVSLRAPLSLGFAHCPGRQCTCNPGFNRNERRGTYCECSDYG